MTLSTEIQTITDYSSTDVDNAVTEATLFCAQYNVDDDELIKMVAIWLLERQTEERQRRRDNTVQVRSITALRPFLESLMTSDDDVVDIIVTKNTSPTNRNLTSKWYDP